MSVYIKDMEMPDSCNHCFVTPGCCPAVRKRIKSDKPGYKWIPANYRHEDCPLIEVPAQHGRLIDADKLKSYWEPDHSRYFDADYFIHTIDTAQTIIPASEEG